MCYEDLLQWHRLFGIALTDLFSGSPWRVELEKELALHSQLLDVVIIEQADGNGGAQAAVPELPDGLEGLRRHNLLTYKSRHEALDAWALDELIGHYVNYRKLVSREREGAGRVPRPERLLPKQDFRLYAVATRYPEKLARGVALEPAGPPGVYDLRWGGRRIRLIVLSDIAEEPRNAPWELFSTRMEQLRHGAWYYLARRHPEGAATLLYSLYLRYKLESSDMAYTLEDFVRETHQHVLSGLSPEERQAFFAGIPADERQAFFARMPADERQAFFARMSADERQAFFARMSADERQAFFARMPADERQAFFARMPADERQAFFARMPADERRALLANLSAEERLRGLPAEERLRGLSNEELDRLVALIADRRKH